MTATTSRQPAVSCATEAPPESADSYVARVLSVVRPLPARPLSLTQADGAVLAEDIWADAELRQLAAGTCMRIMTGALLPAGADAVVRVEWTDGGTERVAISAPVRAGDSVRRSGSDVRPGELLLAAGTRLGPAQLGLLAAVKQALPGADMLITGGGISMGGEHDAIKAALRDLGTVSFGKVAMHPGMTQGFGTAGPEGTPIITLPGNPVSAFVSFRLFVAPAVRALQGLRPETPRRAVLTAPLRSPAGRRSFVCGVFDQEHGAVTPAPGPSAHRLTALARSNALIVVPEQVTALAAGAAVEVLGMQS
jgi:molybdopterin molybdotransferase